MQKFLLIDKYCYIELMYVMIWALKNNAGHAVYKNQDSTY